MAQNEVDSIDLGAIVLYPIAAGVIFGVWTLQVTVFGGWAPSDTLFNAAGTAISWALLVALACVAWIVGTNQIDGSDYESWEYAIIAFAFLSVPLYVFVPAFNNFVNTYDVLKLVAFLLCSVVPAYVAWTE